MSRPKKQYKVKEKAIGFAQSDDKTIKLSKQEEENEIKRRKALYDRLKSDKEKERTMPIKEQLNAYEEKVGQSEMEEMKFNFARMVNNLRTTKKFEKSVDPEPLYMQMYEKSLQNEQVLRTPNDFVKKERNQMRRKVVDDYHWNSELVMNKGLKVEGGERELGSKRVGLLGYKVGMTSQWSKWGVKLPLTIIQVDRCQVTQVKTKDIHGYDALQLGAGSKNLKQLTKPEIGHLLKHNIAPKQHYREFKCDADNLLPVGYQMSVRHYTPGQYIDIQAVSIDKGFQGTVKRWNFKMQPRSHGNSLSHRALGSTGQRTDAGKVFKNKKMAGHLGNKNALVRNLKVYKIDVEQSLLYVIGSVPGKCGNLVRIRDAYTKTQYNHQYLNFPTFVIKHHPSQYAQQILMQFEEEDPNEQYAHDNDVID